MSGFAIIFDQQEKIPPSSTTFNQFVNAVAAYKSLDTPQSFVTRSSCLAAKLNTTSALHQEIIEDSATGSWLLAAGTVIDESSPEASDDLSSFLQDYLDKGSNVFARLDGHFAMIIYNGRTESLEVIADPFGIISLFYAQRGHQFFISTSALAVAEAVGSPPSEFGLRFFLIFGNVFGDMTLWQDVKRLTPATVLTVNKDKAETSSYWAIEVDPAITTLSQDVAVDYVIDLLSKTTHRGLSREVKSWLSLTGGFDSRTLSMAAYFNDIPFKAYCHGPRESSDVVLAERISQTMGWEYEYFPLPEDWGKERPQWFSRTLGQADAHLDIFKTSRIIREQTLKAAQYPVSLWGFGGEIYRGYYWKQEFFNVGVSPEVSYERLFDYRLSPYISWPILNNTDKWNRQVRQHLDVNLKQIGEKHHAWLNTAKLDVIGTHLEGTVHAGSHISAVLGLQRAMAPFYFKEAMQGVISVSHKWRNYNRLFRLMLERATPKLAGIETADGGPALPMRWTNLYKFSPYWYREGKKLVWSASNKFLGVQLWDKGRNVGSSYLLGQWRRDTLAQLEAEGLLTPSKMHSINLYDVGQLKAFFEQAHHDDFSYESLLGRVVTVEMALRAVGTSI